MIDIGYQIPQIGQIILYIMGSLLIIAGVIFAIISVNSNRKSKKTKLNQSGLLDGIQNESQDEIQTKSQEKTRRRRSSKY